MNLLLKALKSSQRGTPRHWLAHRYILRALLVILCVFIYEYYSYTSPRSYEEIVNSKILRIGYLKSPDVAYENGRFKGGLELEIIEQFADSEELDISLTQLNKQSALIALNNNQVDILIGHITKKSSVNGTPIALNNTPIQWSTSKVTLIEYKKPKTPKTKKLSIDAIVYSKKDFGMDASEIPLNIEPVNPETLLLNEVSYNNYQFAITTRDHYLSTKKYFPKVRRIKELNQTVELVWLINKSKTDFEKKLNDFLGSSKTKNFIQSTKSKYKRKLNYLSFIDRAQFKKQVDTVLPKYIDLFKTAANEYNLDWTLLAALSYKESHWEEDAVSPTKVKGIMQMTKSTAERLGVKDRENSSQVIQGAAKYLQILESKIPKRAKREDRIWMAVASYNLGLGKILSTYKRLREHDINTISWSAISHQLTKDSELVQNNEYNNGVIAVKYVERIKEFQQLLRYYTAH